MISAQFTRFAQILLLAAASAALAAPALAAGGSAAAAPPDAFERYVAAHPYGLDVTNIPPDAFDRYAATHAAAPLTDGRSSSAALATPALAAGGSGAAAPPDAFERYVAAHPYGLDVTNIPPDAFDRYAATHAAAPLTDGRLPDTADAALSTQSPQPANLEPANTHTPRGFDWNDAGLGAVATLITLGAVAGSMLLLIRLHRRQRIQTT